jgi:hypothetical protein
LSHFVSLLRWMLIFFHPHIINKNSCVTTNIDS